MSNRRIASPTGSGVILIEDDYGMGKIYPKDTTSLYTVEGIKKEVFDFLANPPDHIHADVLEISALDILQSMMEAMGGITIIDADRNEAYYDYEGMLV